MNLGTHIATQRDRCFIIAEAGVNHNGSEEMALRLVDVAAEAGADAVKFQTFDADKLVLKGASKAEYQKTQTGDGDQHSMLRALEMTQEMHHKVVARCRERGIEFMSTAFDESAAQFLLGLGMQRIKVPSGELTNHPFIAFLAGTGKPLILSTGMATLTEVMEAVEVVRATRAGLGLSEPLEHMLTVLHCTSNYPAALQDVNLRAMSTMGQATGLPVGYSDHTGGILIAPVAVGLGARVIEKHFTLDRSLPGPDHQASLEPLELAEMVRQIRAVEAALGDGCKAPTASEAPVRALVRRSIVLARPIGAGHRLTQEDLTLLRPGHGLAPKHLGDVVGKQVRAELPAFHLLSWDDLA